MKREPIPGGTVNRFVVIIEKLSCATRALLGLFSISNSLFEYRNAEGIDSFMILLFFE